MTYEYRETKRVDAGPEAFDVTYDTVIDGTVALTTTIQEAKPGSPVVNRDAINARLDAAEADLRKIAAGDGTITAAQRWVIFARALIGIIRYIRQDFSGTD